MRVLLDECVNRRLARYLEGHESRTVQQMRWDGIKNGNCWRWPRTSLM
jgi:hypothetical protein